MKKKLAMFLLVGVMALSFFAVPAMAADVIATEPAVEVQEIAPLNEATQTHWRIYDGRLQFRIWGVTNGVWLTPWTFA